MSDEISMRQSVAGKPVIRAVSVTCLFVCSGISARSSITGLLLRRAGLVLIRRYSTAAKNQLPDTVTPSSPLVLTAPG